jgi:hypothetical protein
MSPGNQGVFPAPEKGDFSKNSDIFQLVKMGPFWEYLFTAWCALIGWLYLVN